MHAANPWKSYRRIATQTAPPGQLVLMLFDGALGALDRALDGFDKTDIGERNTTIHNNLAHAVDIIRELNCSLDLEAGGQLADTLRNLYTYFERRLLESNHKKSRAGVEDVLPMLRQLRDAWANMLAGGSRDITPLVPLGENPAFTSLRAA
jgi:flagellar protein FliS